MILIISMGSISLYCPTSNIVGYYKSTSNRGFTVFYPPHKISCMFVAVMPGVAARSKDSSMSQCCCEKPTENTNLCLCVSQFFKCFRQITSITNTQTVLGLCYIFESQCLLPSVSCELEENKDITVKKVRKAIRK